MSVMQDIQTVMNGRTNDVFGHNDVIISRERLEAAKRLAAIVRKLMPGEDVVQLKLAAEYFLSRREPLPDDNPTYDELLEEWQQAKTLARHVFPSLPVLQKLMESANA